ncbi:DNA repair protein RecO [Pseudoxanthomonas gei]|uniref:DNA repair protein RecO n=1 Tax=Pseudoxanthomonas gei TaxID=1383030 RepID=A0ABX0ABR1_9GAMM|nr:DNA repair protein RecO [Pseudoxanthomonas gei]NDK37696.1 DNA repair protein RecO [Pseudoxanthomonas gei]
MRITAEPAFVLHARAWRETSLLVEVLSENHGRLGLVARGVQGQKKHVLRAALQPLQHIRLDAVQRGELAQLVSAEALDAAPRLAGDAMLAAFYINELVMRLAPRQDPHGDLYRIYGQARARLGSGEALAWNLRRFERDLLESLGSGFDFREDADGVALDPAARYRIDPEQGPRRLLSDRGREERNTAATGSGLLALAADRQPEADDLASLRLALRSVLAHHLGGRGLKSWEMLGELGRLRQRE